MTKSMKRKILYISSIFTALFVSCNDYLDTVNYSKVDNTFVFQSDFEANKAVLGAYEHLRGGSGIHSNGLYYDWIQANSDIEIMPEKTTSNARYNAGNFWPQPVNIASGTASLGNWDNLYNLINRCNIILESFNASPGYQEQKSAGTATALTTMYGEVAAIRAICYYELTRLWGDCFYSTEPIRSQEAAFTMQMVDRNDVQEAEIAHLKEVLPLMYKLGQGGYTAQRLTQGAAYGVIARLSLLRGGYALRPADWDMSNFEAPIQTDGEWGKMARRNDWKEWYKEANTALKQVRDNGGASLVTSGDNPFQLIFQQMLNLTVSPEMLFEVPEMPGISTCERPYAFGRPSSGPTGTGYPPKAYGQTRFVPSFYWGDFDTRDLRRDVTVTVSGLSGSAGEVLIPWTKGNTAGGGGPALNKWDYSRQPASSFSVTVKTSRKAGISAPYMRLGDMILLLAETEAVLAKEGEAGYSTANAISELRKIRTRAFISADQATKVDAYLNSLTTADQVVKAVQDERKYELAGEGQRKYDLVRWGLLADQTNWLQKEIVRTIEDLDTKGYVQYDNGNQFPSYVYIKFFSKDEAMALGLGSTLTTNMPLDVDPAKDQLTDLQAMQIPGWRGNADWTTYATGIVNYRCMAIQGLFRYIEPDSQEAKDLEAKGYTRTAYGAAMVTNQVDWLPNTAAGVFGGYTQADYTAQKPPRYIMPYPNTTIDYSGGLVQNKYGYPQK
jgi:hypothetical protein